MVTPGVASLAARFARTTALLVIKWSGWAICWLPVIVGGMGAMLVDTLHPALNAPMDRPPATRGATYLGMYLGILTVLTLHAHLAWPSRAGLFDSGARTFVFWDYFVIRTRAPMCVHARAQDTMPDLLALCLVRQGTTISQLGLSRRQR